MLLPTRKGEANNKAKLTANNVREIRASTETRKEIAARFNIDVTNVSQIRLRHTWRHI